ncbi:30S ribosomal protein S13, chloroplastic-like [Triticum aestivum]|uniref:30S ribosomal protein S13, chloroplastic-like n=1 Tax=Triticum aestivum TaxID=4565 RepID=UPI001D0167EE|nr:30S ribosomal protein S13, chloroplastic-like [Triticum aestivum]
MTPEKGTQLENLKARRMEINNEHYGGFGHGGFIDSIRVGGVVIPNHKRVECALQSIHGIGRARARHILSELNLENKVTKDLSKEEIITLREGIAKYMIEGDLRRFKSAAIERLERTRCYRGIQHEDVLLVCGQRTKTNGRTHKEKRA